MLVISNSQILCPDWLPRQDLASGIVHFDPAQIRIPLLGTYKVCNIWTVLGKELQRHSKQRKPKQACMITVGYLSLC